MHSNLATQVARGSLFTIGAALVTIVLGFVRAVLLLRLLGTDGPGFYGMVTLALFYVALVAQFRALGLDYALIVRQDADEGVLRTYFTLQIGTILVSSLVLVLLAPLIGWFHTDLPLLSVVVMALAGVEVAKGFSNVQEVQLNKALAFRQLAIINIAASVVMTLVAPTLAWAGWGVWALVAEQASGIVTRLLLTWMVFRQWTPHLGWDRAAADWFWRYGRPSWGASNLNFLLARFDDFWIGSTLGGAALGFYNRAYDYAQYPRRVVANPLIGMFSPVFARLQADRLRLSQAFYRAAYLILRSGLLLAGAFALVMPEFIQLVIGVQWLPMLLTFRLLLVYSMLDSLQMLNNNLLFSTGRPQQAWRTMRMQALFFIPAVVIGAWGWGINGVALAVSGMLLVGFVVVYHYIRQIVDFSLARLVLWPLVALVLAGSAGLTLELLYQGSLWMQALGKLLLFSSLYSFVLIATERTSLLHGLQWIRTLLRERA